MINRNKKLQLTNNLLLLTHSQHPNSTRNSRNIRFSYDINFYSPRHHQIQHNNYFKSQSQQARRHNHSFNNSFNKESSNSTRVYERSALTARNQNNIDSGYNSHSYHKQLNNGQVYDNQNSIRQPRDLFHSPRQSSINNNRIRCKDKIKPSSKPVATLVSFSTIPNQFIQIDNISHSKHNKNNNKNDNMQIVLNNIDNSKKRLIIDYQKTDPINTLKFINQKLKQLKISQSRQPIVQPYRDRSTDSYHYGRGYGYSHNHNYDHDHDHNQNHVIMNNSMNKDTIIPQIIKNTNKPHKINQQTYYNVYQQFYTNYDEPDHKDNLIHGNKHYHHKQRIIIKQINSAQIIQQQQQQLHNKYNYMDIMKLKEQQLNNKRLSKPFDQIQKQNEEKQQYLVYQQQKQQQYRQFKQIQMYRQRQRQRVKFIEKQKQALRLKKLQQKQQMERRQQSQSSLSNMNNQKQGQPANNLNITQIYQPYSMNLSSNHKDHIIQQKPTITINQNGNINRFSPTIQTLKSYQQKQSQQAYQQQQEQQGQDKWDKILKLRQQKYRKVISRQSSQHNQNISNNNSQVIESRQIYVSPTSNKHDHHHIDGNSINNSPIQRVRNYEGQPYIQSQVKPYHNRQQHQTYIKQDQHQMQNKVNASIYQFQRTGRFPVYPYQYNSNSPVKQQYQQQEQLNSSTSKLYRKIQHIANIYNTNTKNNVNRVKNEHENHDTGYSKEQIQTTRVRVRQQQPQYPNISNTNNNAYNNNNNNGRVKLPEQMKQSYSFQQNKHIQYQYQKQLFSKFLDSNDIQWMFIYNHMMHYAQSKYLSQLQLQLQTSNLQNGMLITYVKIGDGNNKILQHTVIAHYIGIWLLYMGYDDEEVKQRVIGNVETMMMKQEYFQQNNVDNDNALENQYSKQQEQPKQYQYFQQRNQNKQNTNIQPRIQTSKQRQANNVISVRQIAQLMYNNLLYGYLPVDLQLKTLLQICKRGWQYFAFLMCKILKNLAKIHKIHLANHHGSDIKNISQQALKSMLKSVPSQLLYNEMQAATKWIP